MLALRAILFSGNHKHHMEPIGYIASGIFIFGYILIAFEQKLSSHRSAIALLLGTALWFIVALYFAHAPEKLKHAVETTGAELFGVVAFCLAAMALVEILSHYGFFDMIKAQLVRIKVGPRKQFAIMMFILFWISSFLSNIAMTVAMIHIARKFFKGHNLMVAACAIVVLANAGGAWSPIGDVSTVLLWLNDKFTVWEVVSNALVPTMALGLITCGLLYKKMNDEDFIEDITGTNRTKFSLSERAIVGTAIASFFLPLGMNAIGLPPYFGLLFGLGLTWAMIEFAKVGSRTPHQTHLTADVEHLVQTIDTASIKFLIGVLLAASALTALGVSDFFASLFGEQPSDSHLILAGIGAGLLSAFGVENTAVVAMTIDTLPTADPRIWSLVALTVGTGASAVMTGSSAGIIAAGMVKSMTFYKYYKIVTWPMLLGFAAAILVWLFQYWLI